MAYVQNLNHLRSIYLRFVFGLFAHMDLLILYSFSVTSVDIHSEIMNTYAATFYQTMVYTYANKTLG